MLSLKEAAEKAGLQYPIRVRSLAVSKTISGDFITAIGIEMLY
jgi:hypothetical protein